MGTDVRLRGDATLRTKAIVRGVALAALVAILIGMRSSGTADLELHADAAPSLAIDGYEIITEDIFDDVFLGVAIEADRNGHFRLEARVNGRRLPFLVDTGASYVALNYDDARRAGVRLSRRDFRHEVSTANGRVHVAAVELSSIEYRSIRMRNVVAMVTPRGAMDTNLLGNSFLSRLRTFRVENGRLIMR